MGMNKKKCADLLGDLSAYLDGDVGDDACTQIERHLEHCENCRIVVDTVRKTVYLYRQLPQPPLPGEVRERLYKTLNLRP